LQYSICTHKQAVSATNGRRKAPLTRYRLKGIYLWLGTGIFETTDNALTPHINTVHWLSYDFSATRTDAVG